MRVGVEETKEHSTVVCWRVSVGPPSVSVTWTNYPKANEKKFSPLARPYITTIDHTSIAISITYPLAPIPVEDDIFHFSLHSPCIKKRKNDARYKT